VAEKYGLDPEDSDTRLAVSVRRAARELDRRQDARDEQRRKEEEEKSKPKKRGLL
jgi:hypothetical protein